MTPDFANLRLIRSTPTEECYECDHCGKEKLYRNQETGLYHCFVCGQSGRSSAAMSLSVPVGLYKELPSVTILSSAARKVFLRQRLPVITEDWWATQASSFIEQDTTGDRGLVLEGRLPDRRHRMVGYQLYRPGTHLRYCTMGERGFTPFGDKGARRIYLCEGMWDALAVAERVQNAGLVVFLAGNQLVQKQVQDLRYFLGTQRVMPAPYLCFDNDKVRPFMDAINQLAPWFGHVRLWAPPIGAKDWDEALRQGAAFPLE